MTTAEQSRQNKIRQQRFRDRKKDSWEIAQETTRAQKACAETLRKQQTLQLIYFGETTPGVDAANISEEIAVAREFARALNQPDVQIGETLTQFCKRVYEAWYAIGHSARIDMVSPGGWSTYHGFHKGCPLFSRSTQTFGEMKCYPSDEPFDKKWKPTLDARGDEVIDVRSLPALPPIPDSAPQIVETKSEVPKVDWTRQEPQLSEEEKKELWALRQHNKNYLETKRQMLDSEKIASIGFGVFEGKETK